jgi:hypothetical protein
MVTTMTFGTDVLATGTISRMKVKLVVIERRVDGVTVGTMSSGNRPARTIAQY